MLVILEGRDGLLAEVVRYAANGKVHLTQAPRIGVRLLADHRDRAVVAVVAFNEFVRLHKHAAGAAARVVDDPLVRLDELGDELNDAGWRVELAVLLRAADGERL